MHFPAGQLPPNNAFWSLTMGDAKNHFVPNPLNRYSVSDRSGLVPNADGSVDIYIQNAAPAGHESNWLPAPSGNFILWLRVYLPGQLFSTAVQGAAGRRNTMISPMKHKHLIIFGSVMVVAWVVGTFLFIYFWPHLVTNHLQESDSRSRVRRRPRPDQYALHGTSSALCRSLHTSCRPEVRN